jgi:hypothetical protein
MTTCGTTPPPPRASPSSAPRRAPASSTSPRRPSTANPNTSPSTRATPREPLSPLRTLEAGGGAGSADARAWGRRAPPLQRLRPRPDGDIRRRRNSKFVERAKRGLPPVIYGDGTQTRDFIHVADVASFVEVVLDRGAAGVFNVGTGRAVSIRELATIVMRLAGLSGEPALRPA